MPPSVTGPVLARAAAQLASQGAAAVVLVGSEARRDAHALSDIDLYAIGSGPAYRLDVVSGRLVSVSWRSEQAVRDSFRDPAQLCQAVPAWAGAVLLQDPSGIAAELLAGAAAFDWAEVADACDTWAAEALTGYAEEALKLRAALERGDAWLAAVQRQVISNGLAAIMAVHLRLLYGTENVLWERVAEALGDEWRRAQATAFGEGGDTPAEAATAALRLLQLAAAGLDPILSERQRAVLVFALED